jgi:hypothetical protein
MRFDFYNEIEVSASFETFDFISYGINGSVNKRVIFSFVQEPNIYNLAFGDVEDDGSINDMSTTDNQDMPKILATIARIIKIFLDKYPERQVFFTGSTISRTRLYRMAISNNLDELKQIYTINAVLANGQIINFSKNLSCTAFIIKIKY